MMSGQCRLYGLLTVIYLAGCTGEGTQSDVNEGAGDTLLAAPTFVDVPGTQAQQAFARFGFSSIHTNQFECQLDDESPYLCNSPELIYPLEKGPHSFTVRAVDDNGVAGQGQEYQWSVDDVFVGQVPEDLIVTGIQPERADPLSWRGIFRINCDFSHGAYNDPIVFPNQSNAAHLHHFYGNTLTDENSTTETLFTLGESSCQGNLLNRSAYWVPALLAPDYDPISGDRVIDSQGEPAWKAVPAVVGNDEEAHEIFYYSAGVSDLSSIQPIPVGLKMIAGDHMGKPGNEQDTAIVRWHCQSWESNDATNPRWSSSIPECVAPDRVRMDVFFPSCWNGVDLDSADHKSHMAYPVSEGGDRTLTCPSSHPIPLVRVSFHYAFGVKPDVYEPVTQSSKGWRFASDSYQVDELNPGGMSLHGDWFNAWHPQIMQQILEGCIRQGLDCHDGNLANGFRLSGTRPGTQTEPLIINEGRGH